MKQLALLMTLTTALLAGCVVAPVPHHDRPPPRGYEQGDRHDRGDRRDRDRDGVPNRYDRDRDGDGVPNSYDRRPNDPRRY